MYALLCSDFEGESAGEITGTWKLSILCPRGHPSQRSSERSGSAFRIYAI